MSNEWTTLHTVEHKSHARGVDISVTYHLQARPEANGDISLRIFVAQNDELPTIPLPSLAADEKYRLIPGTGGKVTFAFRPEHILCLPCEPLSYRHCLCDAHLPNMRASIGWQKQSNVYTFVEWDGRVGSTRDPNFNDSSSKIPARFTYRSFPQDMAPKVVAANLEFIKNSIAWREACLDEFNDWCAVFEAKERQNNDNKAKAQGTIDGLADLIAKLTA